MRIAIINGVNLGCLGTREVNIYGSQTFEEYFKQLQQGRDANAEMKNLHLLPFTARRYIFRPGHP